MYSRFGQATQEPCGFVWALMQHLGIFSPDSNRWSNCPHGSLTHFPNAHKTPLLFPEPHLPDSHLIRWSPTEHRQNGAEDRWPLNLLDHPFPVYSDGNVTLLTSVNDWPFRSLRRLSSSSTSNVSQSSSKSRQVFSKMLQDMRSFRKRLNWKRSHT